MKWERIRPLWPTLRPRRPNRRPSGTTTTTTDRRVKKMVAEGVRADSNSLRFFSALLAIGWWLAGAAHPPNAYSWLSRYDPSQSIVGRIPPPAGFVRRPVADGSFDAWLRGLPLKPGTPPVLLHTGQRKANQTVHVAVVDIDVGARDVQQCADAVMRLRAEYLFAQQNFAAIHFNFTSGDRADYVKWKAGFRPSIRGNRVTWVKSAAPDASRAGFRHYLDQVFTYAGSASLSRELTGVPLAELRIGDVFIQGGFPGHAVLVVDTAVEPRTGRKVFLLAQSYMPAQDIHILKNPTEPSLGPWYRAEFSGNLTTPEWTFTAGDLKRF